VLNESPVKDWSEGRNNTLRTFSINNGEVTSAASYLRDAILLTKSTSVLESADQYYKVQLDEDSTISQLSRRIIKYRLVKSLVHACALGLIFLSFIEPPSWCRTFDDGDDIIENGCDLALKKKGIPSFYSNDSEEEIQDYYPNAKSNLLSVHQSLFIERLLVLVISAYFIMSFASYNFSMRKYFAMDVYSTKSNALIVKNLKMSSAVRIARLISILLLIFGLRSVERPFAIYLRMIVFISFSETAQQQFLIASKLVPALLSVSTVLLFVITFYGIIGVFLFNGSVEGSEFFPSLLEAMWTLWTSMTSVIYPDLMMSAYNENRLTAIYFVSFMILTFFFFLNVILALVFTAYENTLRATHKQIEDVKADCIEQAFNILDKENTGSIPRTSMMSVFLILNEDYDEIRTIPENDAELMFALLDQSGSDCIDLKEFQNFGIVLLLEFKDYSKTTWFENKFPTFSSTSSYHRFSNIIQSETFETAIDFVIIANCIVVLIQSYPELLGHEVVTNNVMIQGGWEVMEVIFTLLYVLEMIAKIVVLGWDRYSSSLRHVFDGLITVLCLSTIIVVYYPNECNNPVIIQVVLVLRIFRIVRLFMVMESFQIIGRTFVAILPSAGRAIVLLFCIMYVFSAIGMQFFGGLINRDPENSVSYLLEGTDFAGALYWANNFNDLLSGINVIFNLLVINNWNEMESGILAVSQTKQSRWFFFTFYIFGVILVNNLVIALSIDTFNNELEDDSKNGKNKKFSFLGKRLVFDANKLSKGNFNLSGNYEANLYTEHMTVREEKEILVDLFDDRGYTV